ncbi:hypothetical protein HYZ98_05345 [Candidatus Peregrinibacteria bacterium]|nr:hypothetical protein [Candidatus Peregrinibacteria bacterium]
MNQQLEIHLKDRWSVVSAAEFDAAMRIARKHGLQITRDYEDGGFLVSSDENKNVFSFVVCQGKITNKLRDDLLAIFHSSRVSSLKEGEWVDEQEDRVISYKINNY